MIPSPHPFQKSGLAKMTASVALSASLVVHSLLPSAAFSSTLPDPVTTTGPWGTIEYYEVELEPPTSVFWKALFDERSFWNFGELPREACVDLLTELGFAPELVEKIDSEGIWTKSDLETEVEFGDDIVEAMTTSNRTELSKWFRANNPGYLSKQIMNLEIHDDTALHLRLKPSTVAMLRSVTFLRNKVVSMMDRPYLMRQLGDDQAEKEALVQTLFSTNTLVGCLVVDEGADLESLIKYWSADGKNPNARVILEGVNATPGVDRIDLIHLLPPFPKKYLGTFIKIEDAGPIQSPDCFWASLHFFKHRVNPRVLDKLYIDHYIEYDFDKVEGEATFGDIVMLFDRNTGKFIHAYIHIAGPLVFTKNGSSFARPIIMKTYDDMISVYEEGFDFVIETYRRKPGT